MSESSSKPWVLTREAVRELDRQAIEEFGVPGIVLMENAGRGCADILQQLGARGPVAICCGRGNNAGDGLVLARHLELRGIASRLLFWSDPRALQGDAATNYAITMEAGLPLGTFCESASVADWEAPLRDADWIVDALLGTGAQGEPRPPLDAVITLLNQHAARKLAIDIPSGLDCETGRAARHTFRAEHTCTFVAAKPGLVAPHAQEWVGQLHVVDIGAPLALLRRFGFPAPAP
jgi:NAD(P)H-hydrate epimerase